ncbi:restriction endonuclease [Halobaculum sp. WSA2]|uniref:Restriction endonuclease n=1 Tax=Halobaculum saliterrae TaxID=2073113 RepID=A0A6B0SN74_9EURY|nr:HNH endonuclease [Halobaculum saliterrae]MXR39817.1 restriction endonuclease [Halobaculum saliterrae]
MSSRGPIRDLAIGEVLTQEEVESVFDTKFGYQFKGITYRNPSAGRYVIINANEGAIYKDEFTSETELTYDGEGEPEKGDQMLTNANRAMVEAEHEEIPIYLFTSEDGLDEYEYEGLVEVTDARYENELSEDRMKYKFDLQKLGLATWDEYLAAATEVKEDSEEPLIEKPEREDSSQLKRSAAFKRKVRSAYDYSCAICGSERRSPIGNPEIEAAHIYPKSKGGRDVASNGIGLCKLHHWAFDVGWFAISDDYEVIVGDSEEIATPDEVLEFEGKNIEVPSEANKSPGELFLREHRKLHGFE